MKLIFYMLEFGILLLANVESKKFIPKTYKIDDKILLEKQLKILQLFENINQPLSQQEMRNFQLNNTILSDSTWVEFSIHNKTLTKGDIFSVFYKNHLDAAIALFKVFYYSKDFDIFIDNALYARNTVNEAMFLYAFSVSIIHREDTFGLILPPIYEINPYYFFNSEIIYKAQQYKQYNEGLNISIEDDQLQRYTDSNPEKLLTYFTEDIGLNAFYYYYHIFYPWWMDGKEFGLEMDHRGELFYYVIAQLVARYDLERLSNGLEEVTAIDFNSPLNIGYYPSLIYPNGVAFPSRPDGIRLDETSINSKNDNIAKASVRLHDIALRIQNVVDLGRAYSGVEIYKEGIDGLEILSNLLEGNPNSPELPYYGNLQIYARYLLGYSPEPLNKNKAIPAAIQHYETSLRDVATWKFFKWILQFYDDFFKHTKPYTLEELSYADFLIDNFEVHEFVTFFETSYSDINQAVFHSDGENRSFNVDVKQKRLNHLPLQYNITVNCTSDEIGLIKVFLGPKFDRYGNALDLLENREKFYVIDHFYYKFKSGINIIQRNVSDGPAADDRTKFRDLDNDVTNAIQLGEEFVIGGADAYWTFPSRLHIPKGSLGGMVFQLFAIVVPQKEGENVASNDQTYKASGTGRHTGSRSLRFPLDRRTEIPLTYLSNVITKDVLIRHDNSI